MTRPSTPPILSELRSPSSTASQVAALRALKNEVIGHEQKKGTWVRLGIVAPLSRLLQSSTPGSKRSRDVEFSEGHGKVNGLREDAILQAVIILGSLAHGGPAYLPSLQAGAVYPALLCLLDQERSSPTLVLATLRSLNCVADAYCLESLDLEASRDDFSRLLYADLHLTNLAKIIDRNSTSLMAQQQISLVASLITKTCRREVQRNQLSIFGMLSALARRLASFVAATNRTAVPQGEMNEFLCTVKPATSHARLAPILHAIGSIILDSRPRTVQFLCAIDATAVFSRAQGNADDAETIFPLRSTIVRPGSVFHQQKESLSRFSKPEISGLIDSGNRANNSCAGFSSALKSTPVISPKDFDLKLSPLIPWLVNVVRAESGVTRLMAAWVLTLLYRTGLGRDRKAMTFAPLLVPLLVRMLDEDPKLTRDTQYFYDSSILQAPDRLIKEYAPKTLATLIVENLELQQVAHSAGVIKKLSDLLKRSFTPRPRDSNSQWSPDTAAAEEASQHTKPAVARLGTRGISHHTYHALRVRESTLTALAAMATFKDEYRGSIIDAGAIPLTIESLKPLTASHTSLGDDGTEADVVGNPVPVLLAACGTARALSRSVKMLRTSLTDADLATPLYALLQYDNLEVQVAATTVICNLLLEFSPMRESVIEAGIAEILCKRAHSGHAKLRLNSIWSLKHLVHSAPSPVKMKCLKDLGPGWLKQIVSNEPNEYAESASQRSNRATFGSVGTPIRMGTPNAIGEQVDLLNAMEMESLHSNPTDDEDDMTACGDQEVASAQVPTDLSILTNADQQRLEFLHEEEMERLEQATRDRDLTQEQGLDLVRNLLCGSGSAEMIDYLFRELGQDTLFDLLAARLRPRVIHPLGPDCKSPDGAKNKLPSTQIITSILYIIVHIAAGLPRHRQLLISQPELLRLIVPLFSHDNYDVRTACVFLVINLTWIDDQADRQHCRARAHELRKLGVYEKLVHLERVTDKDIHERATLAMNQMTDLLR